MNSFDLPTQWAIRNNVVMDLHAVSHALQAHILVGLKMYICISYTPERVWYPFYYTRPSQAPTQTNQSLLAFVSGSCIIWCL